MHEHKRSKRVLSLVKWWSAQTLRIKKKVEEINPKREMLTLLLHLLYLLILPRQGRKK
jgi:hypothetical protein